MSDRVLIPVPGVGTLAMTLEAYQQALADGAQLCPAPAPAAGSSDDTLLVSSEELGRRTDTAASWWEAAAREGDCPSVFVGRVRRFDVKACMRWLAGCQERDGAGRVKRCAVAPRARA